MVKGKGFEGIIVVRYTSWKIAIRRILKHIFNLKNLLINGLRFTWVMLMSWIWIGGMSGVAMSLSVVVGSMMIQGLIEWKYE